MDASKVSTLFTEPPQSFHTQPGVEVITKARGDDQIFRSAGSECGDYGEYSTLGRVRTFLTLPLADPQPNFTNELKQGYHNDVAVDRQDRVVATV